MNNNTPTTQGFTLIEILIAIGFVIILGTLALIPLKNFKGLLTLDSVTQDIVDRLRYAQNQTIASTQNQQYGIHFETISYTTFQGASYSPIDPSNTVYTLPQDVQITGINLESGSDVVFNKVDGTTANGGTLSITAFQNSTSVKTNSVTINNLGKIIAGGGQSGDLVVDTSLAALGGGNTNELLGITLENIGSTDLTIDTINVSWTDSNRVIEEIFIDTVKVWGHTGPGTPLGKQDSGIELDIQDVVLAQGSGVKNIDKFEFNGVLTGNIFTIVFTLSDASQKTVVVDFSAGGGGETCSASDHIHYEFNWGIGSATTLTLTFEKSGGGQDIFNVDFQDFVSGGKFNWEDTVIVEGETQDLRLHTHQMNPSDTRFCIHRDDDEVNKAFSVAIDSTSITTYDVNGNVTTATGVTCEDQNDDD